MSHRCDSTNSHSATCCCTCDTSAQSLIWSRYDDSYCYYLVELFLFPCFHFLLLPVWMHWQGCCLISLCKNNKGIVMLKCLDLYGTNRNIYATWTSSVCWIYFTRWTTEYREVMEAIAKLIKTSLVPELQLVTYTQWLNHFPRSGYTFFYFGTLPRSSKTNF